jgi:hypothetical protein
MTRYFDALSGEPQFSAWSPAIYDLSRYLQHQRGTIITADWGIFNPLFALRPGRRYDEFAFQLEDSTPSHLRALGTQIAAIPGPKLLVTHAPGELVFAKSSANLFVAAGGHLRLTRTITGAGGVSVYQVYSYR